MSLLRIGMIGSTGHTSYALSGWNSELELVGMAPGSIGESMQGLYEQTVKQGHKPLLFEDYRIMLDTMRPDIAVVACHFHDHANVAIEAMNRGIHVFVEKPVATTLEDLERVRTSFEQNDVRLAAMFGMRYQAEFLTAKKLIQEGKIGSVRLMHAQKSYKLNTRGELFRNRQTYGGTIPWVGSHAIDWMYWLGGQSFQSVFAAHSVLANNGHGDLEATAACQFTFANDVFGTVNVDYLRPSQAKTHGDDRIRVVGTDGIVEVRAAKVFLVNEEFDGTQEQPLLPAANSFADFVRHVRGEGSCMVSAEDSFIVTEACLRARLAGDEKRIVYF